MLAKPFKACSSKLSFDASLKNLLMLLFGEGRCLYVSPELKALAESVHPFFNAIDLWEPKSAIYPHDLLWLKPIEALHLPLSYFYEKNIWVIQERKTLKDWWYALQLTFKFRHRKVNAYRIEPSFKRPVTLMDATRPLYRDYLLRLSPAQVGGWALLLQHVKRTLNLIRLTPNLWVIKP